jgi:hypothetical protein
MNILSTIQISVWKYGDEWICIVDGKSFMFDKTLTEGKRTAWKFGDTWICIDGKSFDIISQSESIKINPS